MFTINNQQIIICKKKNLTNKIFAVKYLLTTGTTLKTRQYANFLMFFQILINQI